MRYQDRRFSRRYWIDRTAVTFVLAGKPLEESADDMEYAPPALGRNPYFGLPYSN